MISVAMKIAGPTLAPEHVCRLQRRAAAAVSNLVDGPAGGVHVLVEPAACRGWAIGGRPTQVAAHVQAVIEARLLTPDHKVQLIAELDGLLRQVFGAPMPSAIYVVVLETAAPHIWDDAAHNIIAA